MSETVLCGECSEEYECNCHPDCPHQPIEERAMATMIHTTREELQAQRKQLLDEIGMTYETLRDRAAAYSLSPDELDVWHTIEGNAAYSLSPDELDVWHTIEGIDYLLEGDS